MSMIFEFSFIPTNFTPFVIYIFLIHHFSAIFQSALSLFCWDPFCCLFTSEEALSLHFYGRTATISHTFLCGKAARKRLNPWLTPVLMKKRVESVDWLGSERFLLFSRNIFHTWTVHLFTCAEQNWSKRFKKKVEFNPIETISFKLWWNFMSF